MATKLSLKEISFSYKNAIGEFYPTKTDTFFSKIVARSLQIYFSIFVNILNFKNIPARIFEKKNSAETKFNPIKINLINENKANLFKNGWCYIENFFDEETYSSLLKHWPKKCFFDLSKKPIKYYYFGFCSTDKVKPKYIDKNPYFSYFYNYLFSSKAAEIFTSFLNEEHEQKRSFSHKSVLCSFALEKSYLIPHMDGISKKSLSRKTFNFIYFLDGNNNSPEYSGATGIYSDNEFKHKVFVPHNLKNSCLIYDSSDNFFHGFKAIKKNGYRKAITFQYFSENLIK